MRKMKKFAALMVLATVASLSASTAFAGGVESPGLTKAGGVESPGVTAYGGVESPGVTSLGGVESPGIAGGVESPGITAVLTFLAGFLG